MFFLKPHISDKIKRTQMNIKDKKIWMYQQAFQSGEFVPFTDDHIWQGIITKVHFYSNFSTKMNMLQFCQHLEC